MIINEYIGYCANRSCVICLLPGYAYKMNHFGRSFVFVFVFMPHLTLRLRNGFYYQFGEFNDVMRGITE